MSIPEEVNPVSETILRGSQLIGKPVIVRDGRNVVELVEDIIFDHISRQIVALIVDKGSSRSPTRILSWGGIQAIEDDAVIAKSYGMIVKARQLLALDRILEFGEDVVGKPLITSGGRTLGKVIDIHINAHTGEITGFRISGSATDDQFIVPAAEISRNSSDGLFVTLTSATSIEQQVSSVSRSMQGVLDEWQTLLKSFESAMAHTTKGAETGTERSRNAAQISAHHMHEGRETINQGERLSETASRDHKTIAEVIRQVRDQLKQVLAERVVMQAQGHSAQHTVLTDDNEFVVIAGQVVSPDVIDDARKHHKEAALLASVGIDLEDISHAHELQRLMKRYAAAWDSEGTAIVNSLRDTALKPTDDAQAHK